MKMEIFTRQHLVSLIVAMLACISCHDSTESRRASPEAKDYADEYSARRPAWVPRDAQIEFSTVWRDGWPDDQGVVLYKIKLPESAFGYIMERLGLVAFEDYSDHDPSSPTKPRWWPKAPSEGTHLWNPGENTIDSFVLQKQDWLQLAKWRDGCMYYQSTSLNGNGEARTANNELLR